MPFLKKTKTMKTTILLLSFLPIVLFAQEFEKEKKFHFGAATNFVTSSMHVPGVNLMAFADFKKHQIAFGPRYSYAENRSTIRNSAIKTKNSSSVILDFSYRYYLLDRAKRFNTFVQLSSELYTRKDAATFFYDPNAPTPEIDASQGNSGPTFDYSFNGASKISGTYVGVYLGVGEEIKITKGLFATVNIGIGKIGGKYDFTMRDDDKNELVLSQNSDYYWNKRVAFTGCAGIGYRF